MDSYYLGFFDVFACIAIFNDESRGVSIGNLTYTSTFSKYSSRNVRAEYWGV